MREIKVTVRDKIATGDGTRIVCGNSDYMVRFDLDADWEQFAVRTMIVINADKTFREYPFTGDSVELPVIRNQMGISIGLYAGDLCTSTSASFDCDKSARCGLGEHEDPPEDVYVKLLALIESGGATDEQIAKAIETYMAEHPVEVNGIPAGGKEGQLLRKKSDSDYDVEWADFEVPEQYGLVTYDQDKTITIT